MMNYNAHSMNSMNLTNVHQHNNNNNNNQYIGQKRQFPDLYIASNDHPTFYQNNSNQQYQQYPQYPQYPSYQQYEVNTVNTMNTMHCPSNKRQRLDDVPYYTSNAIPMHNTRINNNNAFNTFNPTSSNTICTSSHSDGFTSSPCNLVSSSSYHNPSNVVHPSINPSIYTTTAPVVNTVNAIPAIPVNTTAMLTFQCTNQCNNNNINHHQQQQCHFNNDYGTTMDTMNCYAVNGDNFNGQTTYQCNNDNHGVVNNNNLLPPTTPNLCITSSMTTNSTLSPTSPIINNPFNNNNNGLQPNMAPICDQHTHSMTTTSNNNSISSIITSPKVEISDNQYTQQQQIENDLNLPPMIDTKFDIQYNGDQQQQKQKQKQNEPKKPPKPAIPSIASTSNTNETEINHKTNTINPMLPISNNGQLPSIKGNKGNKDNGDNNKNGHFPHFCKLEETSSYDQMSVNKIIFAPLTLSITDNECAVPQSASCHQCKTKKDIAILFYCTHKKPCINNAYKTKVIKCRKKYCQACMTKYFQESDVAQFKKFKDSLSWSFDCPSCQDVCTCRACKRKRAKNNKNDNKSQSQQTQIKPKQEV